MAFCCRRSDFSGCLLGFLIDQHIFLSVSLTVRIHIFLQVWILFRLQHESFFRFCCFLFCPKSSLCFSVRISSGASLDFCTEGRIFFPLRSDWREDLSTRLNSFSPCFPPICTSLARLLTRTEDLSVRFSSTRPSLVIFWTFLSLTFILCSATTYSSFFGYPFPACNKQRKAMPKTAPPLKVNTYEIARNIVLLLLYYPASEVSSKRVVMIL